MWANRNRRLIRFDSADRDFDSISIRLAPTPLLPALFSLRIGTVPIRFRFVGDSISIRLGTITSDSILFRFDFDISIRLDLDLLYQWALLGPQNPIGESGKYHGAGQSTMVFGGERMPSKSIAF